MMSPNQSYIDRRGGGRESIASPSSFGHTPSQIIHIIGMFMRTWSIYSTYWYLSQQGASVVFFVFSCLVPSSIFFLVSQKPWKGRPLTSQQVVPSMINGGITALYFILLANGLKSCGPLIAILAEYAGAVLGVISGVLYGRKDHIWKKVGGLMAMLASFYFLSQGWAMATYSPFSFGNSIDTKEEIKEVLGMKQMAVPIFAGILSALRRVIARRVSLKNQLKRRLHALSIASAACFLFPLAIWDFLFRSSSDGKVILPFSTWAFFSTILFGVILIFYVDNIAEERLHIVFSSPRHLLVAAGGVILLETLYKMDFSLPGFLICSSTLAFGIYEATSLGLIKKDPVQRTDISDETSDNQNHMLPVTS